MSRLLCLVIVLVLVTTQVACGQDVGFLKDVATRLNQERIRHRLKPLKYNKTLEKSAQAHAEWMARNQRMEHLEEAPASLEEHKTSNQHPANRIINAGYFSWDDLFVVETGANGHAVNPRPDTNDRVGEIIAKGAGAGHPATQPPSIVPGWMNSPGHRKTILMPQYQEFGIGTSCTGNDTYWCVVFAKPKK